MKNNKVCLVGVSSDDVAYAKQQGLEVTSFSKIRDAGVHLADGGRSAGYSVIIIQSGQKTVKRNLAYELYRGIAARTKRLAEPGQYGAIAFRLADRLFPDHEGFPVAYEAQLFSNLGVESTVTHRQSVKPGFEEALRGAIDAANKLDPYYTHWAVENNVDARTVKPVIKGRDAMQQGVSKPMR